MTKNSSYTGKLALVIGGSEGIGKAIAADLYSMGCNTIIASRSEEKLKSAGDEISRNSSPASKPQLIISQMDVTDFESTNSKINALVEKHGVPDYVFLCAGFAHPGYIDQLPVEKFHQMMDVNYFGVVHATKALAPHMMKRRSGHIVNCSSIAGFIGLFGYTGYCASKFAVLGFSEALRRELEPYNVKVSVLCPPNTRTPGLEAENKVKPLEVLRTEEKVTVVDPEFVASYVLRETPKNRFLIIPTMDGKLAHYLSRFAPTVLSRFVKRPKSAELM